MTFRPLIIPVVLSGCLMWAVAPARAAEADTSNGVAPVRPVTAANAPSQQPAQPGQANPSPAGADKAPAGASDVQRFCQNVAVAAAEARNAWQGKKLAELQTQLNDTIAQLESKEAALRATLDRRDAALKRADATLVGIFGKMKPDAAAAQLTALDDDTAAAVLQQLNPRIASAILDEIAPDRAAKLVTTIAAPPTNEKKS